MPRRDPVLSNICVTESYYFACGGFADIYEALWTLHTGEVRQVAIKLVRRYTCNDKIALDCVRQQLLREAHSLTHLRHTSLVPFYGLTFEQNFLGLVMPYYKNGDVLQYLQNHPGASKINMTCEVAAGLEYLHKLIPNTTVHGGIKASNIMVTDDGHACLADFGVARMLNISGYMTTKLCRASRWTAPELLEESSPSTCASDIWAFGMTILQIYTGKDPFENLPNIATVIVGLSQGHLPLQPPEIDDAIWALLKRCWEVQPKSRPSASTVSIMLSIISSQNPTTEQVHELVDLLERGNSDKAVYMMPGPMTGSPVYSMTPEYEDPAVSHLQSALAQ